MLAVAAWLHLKSAPRKLPICRVFWPFIDSSIPVIPFLALTKLTTFGRHYFRAA